MHPDKDCDDCDGTGVIRERHERLFDALKRCDREQQVMVADAIRTVLDDLRRLDVLSPSAWYLLGLLDGQGPVREETKRRASQGIAAARRRAA